MSIKRAELKPGEEYWIQPRYKKGQLLPGCRAPFMKVHLVELQSGNRALVQWDVKTFDPPIHPLRGLGGGVQTQVVTKKKIAVVSCADFQYSEADRAVRGTVYNYTKRRLVLGPEPVGPTSLAGQTDIMPPQFKKERFDVI